MSYRSRPESHLAPYVIDTGDIAADGALVLGAEAAWVNGPFSVQGEYLHSSVRENDGQVPSFNGCYGAVSWFLTGESRPYDRTEGRFGRVIPRRNFDFGHGGWGAWEIAARYSYVDLDTADIHGGRLSMLMAGVNWYLHSHVKWRFDYGFGHVSGHSARRQPQHFPDPDGSGFLIAAPIHCPRVHGGAPMKTMKSALLTRVTMPSLALAVVGLLLGRPAASGANVELDSPSTPAGYVALLLINEVPFPGERAYVSEEDFKAAMLSVLWVLHCRASAIPPGYTQRQVAAVETRNVIDVMTAGGIKGQVDGFYQGPDGRPVAVPRVHERVALSDGHRPTGASRARWRAC